MRLSGAIGYDGRLVGNCGFSSFWGFSGSPMEDCLQDSKFHPIRKVSFVIFLLEGTDSAFQNGFH